MSAALLRRWGPALASLALVLTGWELACRTGAVSPVLLAAPSTIARVGAQELARGTWNPDFATTLRAFALALALAGVAGIAGGIAMGASRPVFHLVNPWVVALNALPKIVLCPLVMIGFGTGLSARVFLGALMGVFPILSSTVTGVQSLDRQLVELGRAYGASRARILWSVVLPSLGPFVVSGLRVGLNYAMVGVLVVELFAASQGVGYRLNAYSQNFQVDLFFALVVLVALFVLLLSSAVRRLESRIGGWRDAAWR